MGLSPHPKQYSLDRQSQDLDIQHQALMLDIEDIVFMLPHDIFNRCPVGVFDLGQAASAGLERMTEAIVWNNGFQLFDKYFPLGSWANPRHKFKYIGILIDLYRFVTPFKRVTNSMVFAIHHLGKHAI